MTTTNEQDCERVLDFLAEAVDGELAESSAEHVSSCDACRDLVHDARCAIEWVQRAPDGFVAPSDLEARILAAIDARPSARTLEATPTAVPAAMPPFLTSDAPEGRTVSNKASALTMRRRASVAFAIAAAVTGLGVWRYRQDPTAELATSPWKGIVADVSGAESGIALVDANGTETPLRKGETIAAGARVRTDMRTRARVALDDGSSIVIDRGSEVALSLNNDRSARLNRGAAVFEFAKSTATVRAGRGKVSNAGAAKIALSVADDQVASLSVARGVVNTSGGNGVLSRVNAGEGALITEKGTRMGGAGLAQSFGWADPDIDANVEAMSGLGELRARMPGDKGEGGKALKLAKQNVKVRIAGEIARTEVEQTFASDEPQVLEGIFRFPLPPDAQIERLALDVDGKLEEGAFVDKDKGKAIWRGVLFNATPKPEHKPLEEWIWVPGPWRDPALLEWRAGGRMELRIFPIPAKGSRRVVLAYTQHVPQSAGVRRYVYPLARIGDGKVAVDDFGLDVRVIGHDVSRGVRVRGYETESAGENERSGARRTMSKHAFSPSGDVVVEYEKKSEGAATTYAYKPAGAEASYVALTLSPPLPRVADDVPRTQVLIVDSSRSMVGERYTRASALAARVIEELDPRDKFVVLACDIACVPHALTAGVPSKTEAEKVRTFLAARTADGASNLLGAIESARKFTNGERVRITYIGDGTPTIGARLPATLEAGVRKALGEDTQVTAVPIGVDSDTTALAAIARGGGGTVVPYQAGQPLAMAALDVLEATYANALRDVTVDLPEGLVEVAPSRVGTLRGGQEAMLVARMSAAEVTGVATVRGTLAGKSWSTSFPIAVRATSEEGNAFVPRLFASTTIAELEQKPGDADKGKIVDLSKTFSVPSRHTSLIVLESPAMASAFGVERRVPVSLWSGEAVAVAETKADGSGASGTTFDMDPATGDARRDKESLSKSARATEAPIAAPAPMAGAMRGVPMSPDAPVFDEVPPQTRRIEEQDPRRIFDPRRERRRGEWRRMRREWYRTVAFSDGATLPRDLETRIVNARGQVLASPDSRDKLALLFGFVAQRSSLFDAQDVLSAWTKRDPTDPDATARRAELAARVGDRTAALRIQTGLLESRPDDVDLADRLGDVALRAGDSKLAESLYAVRGELRPFEMRRAVASTKGGDLTIDAHWDGGFGAAGADVDFALIDQKGVRWSWLSPKGVSVVADPSSMNSERLTVEHLAAGTYLVEATRGSGSGLAVGSVKVTSSGQNKTFPFQLSGPRVVVGTVEIRMQSRLVPAD